MANCANSTSTPPVSQSATREDFDRALSQAQIITDIIGELADAEISTTAKPGAALYEWLAGELRDRLERIEVADMTMGRARA